MSARYLLFFLLVFAIPKSFAGLMIEPYLGIGSGSYTSTTRTGGFSIGSPMDSKINGGMVGARLGYKFLGFWTALDYTGAAWEVKYDKPASTPAGKAAGQFIFADVGFDFPFLFRVYGGYGFSNTLKIVGNNSLGNPGEETLSGGSAVKAGLGLTFLPFLSINIEYIKPTFSKYALNVSGLSMTDTTVDSNFSALDLSVTMLSVSFPINLF